MKAQDIEEIAQVADQAITNAIKTQFAESFSKINKKRLFDFNLNLIALFVAAIAIVITIVLVGNSIKDNDDKNAASNAADHSAMTEQLMAVDDSIVVVDGKIASVVDDIADVKEQNATIIEQNTAVAEKQEVLEKKANNIIAQNNKIIKKANNLRELQEKANATQLGNFQNCLIENKTLTPEAAGKKCVDWLK